MGRSFAICDEDDKKVIFKGIIKENEAMDNVNINDFIRKISSAKNEGFTPYTYKRNENEKARKSGSLISNESEKVCMFFEKYEKVLKETNKLGIQ